MQKILTVALSIAVIFSLQLWQEDIACADWKENYYKRCDLSGLWINEPDPESGLQTTAYFIPLDPFKKKYAIPTQFIVPPLPFFYDDESAIPAGGVAERISPCTFKSSGYWFGVSASGERIWDMVLNGTWTMEDKDTAILSGTFKLLSPDGTLIFCADSPDTVFHRLGIVPPSEWPCPEE